MVDNTMSMILLGSVWRQGWQGRWVARVVNIFIFKHNTVLSIEIFCQELARQWAAKHGIVCLGA